jgi:hypothetical protein
VQPKCRIFVILNVVVTKERTVLSRLMENVLQKWPEIPATDRTVRNALNSMDELVCYRDNEVAARFAFGTY